MCRVRSQALPGRALDPAFSAGLTPQASGVVGRHWPRRVLSTGCGETCLLHRNQSATALPAQPAMVAGVGRHVALEMQAPATGQAPEALEAGARRSTAGRRRSSALKVRMHPNASVGLPCG